MPAQLDRGLVDHVLRLLVVRNQLDVDGQALGHRVDPDVAGVDPDLELGRPCHFECLLHLAFSS